MWSLYIIATESYSLGLPPPIEEEAEGESDAEREEEEGEEGEATRLTTRSIPDLTTSQF